MTNMLTGSAAAVKYVMFLFNLLFVLTGVILISVGAAVQGAYHSYKEFLEPNFFSVPTFVVTIGSIIFFIAFFGCCGAIKENYCMVLTFSALLGLVFILELAAGISGYILRDQTTAALDVKLKETLTQYGNLTEVTKLWDVMQDKFDCCGLNGAQDWTEKHNNSIPLSCCTIESGAMNNFTCDLNATTLRKTGCVEAFGLFVSSHAVSLGGAGIGIAFLQFSGIFFACYIAKQIKMRHG